MLWIGLISLAILAVLAFYVMDMPTAAAKKRKEKKLPPPPEPKDWEAIAQRWEKKIGQLETEIERLNLQERRSAEAIEKREKEIKDLMEKLALEKKWREKEAASFELIKTRDNELKEDLVQTQNDLSEEHALRLRIEKELKELKSEFESVSNERRTLNTKILHLEQKIAQDAKELHTLKRENAELKVQRQDVQWIAKTEFDEVKKALQEREKEIERLKRPDQSAAAIPNPPAASEQPPSADHA